MELYQLKTFVTVAGTGHLTRAAGLLNTSQPAVSAQLKALEEELGIQLFIRSSKGMELTGAGAALLDRAQRILAESDLLLHSARALRQEVMGTLMIGLNEDGEFLRIQQLFGRLQKRHPHLEVYLQSSTSATIVRDLGEGRLDCGFLFGAKPQEPVQSISLGRFRILVTAPAAWRDRIQHRSWQEIVTFPWVWQNKECPYRILAERYFTDQRLPMPQSIYTSDHDATTLALVASGVGVGLVKEADARRAERQGQVCLWAGGGLEIELWFGFRTDRCNDPLIRAMLEEVGEVWQIGGESVDPADCSDAAVFGKL